MEGVEIIVFEVQSIVNNTVDNKHIKEEKAVLNRVYK